MKILVVDSSLLILDMLKEVFETEGHTVIKAIDVNKALDSLKNEKPDILITEPITGTKGIIQLLRLYRSIDPVVRIFVMHTSNIVEDSIKYLNCEKFFKKPFRIEDLLYSISNTTKIYKIG